MTRRMHCLILRTLIAVAVGTLAATQSATAPEAAAQVVSRAPQPVVPQMIRYTGVAAGRGGETVEVVFRIYASQEGGEPLWSETQTIGVGADGRYSVLLGSATEGGLPDAVFQGGQGRWLGVNIERAPESGRSVLASVAYAMKAADAESLAGRHAAEFVTQSQLDRLTAQLGNTTQALTVANGVHAELTPSGSGAANTIPLWTSASNLGDSALTQLGTASAPLVGVNNAAPATTLDVAGATTLRGNTSLTPATVATATAGVNSPVFALNASSFQSGAAAVNQRFAWMAQPTGNNTASPGAQLSLLFASGSASNVNTGLFFLSNGSIVSHSSIEVGAQAATPALGGASPSFVLGGSAYNSSTSASVPQVFSFNTVPVGNNTSTPSANLELLFGAGSSAVTATGLSFAPSGVITFVPSQTFPGSGTITGVTAGTGLTGGGAAGAVTVGVDTTKVPLLGAANNNFSGSLSATGAVNASTYDLDGARFAYGNQNGNSFLGFAGNGSVPSGLVNTAVGFEAMTALTTGGANTAIGASTLDLISSGTYNTALGSYAGAGYSNLNDSTAIGANAVVSQNDSLVLGQTTDGSPGKTYVNVGIGTSVPASELELSKSASDALGPVLTLTNPAGDGASAAIDFKTYLHLSTATSPTARIWAVDDNNYGTDLLFLSKKPGSDFNSLQINMAIFANGQVTMGTLSQEAPYEGEIQDAQLTVQGQNGFDGVVGVGSAPVGGSTLGGHGGIFAGGNNADGVWGISGGSLAGFFQGDVSVNGILEASTKDFKIDHPADPANKYLVHSSVESSEMMNIYSGNVVTDELGLATVKLPEWFETENGDFRYQLTTIGRDAHAWIAEEVAHNQFKIATNATFVKVSWQITAVRQDAFAKAHPLVVEVAKPERERGYYIHPELYGQPEEKGIAWARNAKVMQQIKARREADEKRRKQAKK